MPWEFYLDLSRHLWDEVRHSTMGETRLRELGVELTEIPHMTANYDWRQRVDPLMRYTTLTLVIEAASFPKKNESYRNHLAAGDMRSAQALLYDVTDETMHVQYGSKWVPELMKRAGISVPLEQYIEQCRQRNDIEQRKMKVGA
mgnify:CR=1 FL=1